MTARTSLTVFTTMRNLTSFSEKARIPAWTDRILRKGPHLRQKSYNSAPLRFSDHRPVYGTFDCTVSIVNEKRREAISSELYERRKADLGGGDAGGSVIGDLDSEEEDLIGFDALEPGLPAASSDRQKWWLDNKQPARAQITIPNGRNGQPMSLNPNRPANPFPPTDEPDWVSVSRGSPGGLSSMSSSPYEKVPMPPPQAPPGRRLPPAFDPAKLPAQVGRLAIADDQASRRSTDSESQPPPPPPPPRRKAVGQQPATPTNSGTTTQPPPRPASSLSQQSQQSQQSQKSQQSQPSGSKPPPIARKPAHLAGSSSPVSARSVSAAQSAPQQTQAQLQPPLPPRTELSRKPLPPPAESLI